MDSKWRVTVSTMVIDKTIFREYDIRGVAGSEFSPKALAEYEKWYGKFPGITITLEAAEAIGRAYGTLIRRDGGRRVVVGHEIRPFADELNEAFIKGVCRTGCEVTDLGRAVTPLVYFTTAHANYDGGVNITGSHNVYFFNGFKLMRKGAVPIFGVELQEMRKMIEEESYIEEAGGSITSADPFPAYKKYFLEHLHLARKVKIVLDCGNGSGGLFAPELYRELGCEVIDLFSEPDASFPNHVADPEDPENLRFLIAKVREVGADFGIGLDADADRAGFVTEKGDFIDADLALLVLAKDVLSRHSGKKILYDVKCTRLLETLVPTYGGVPLMHRTGHAPIKATLHKDQDIILGGENSGHFYFVEDYFRIDDGMLAGGRMIDLYARQSKPFSELFASIPKTVRTPELKLPCADTEKFSIIEKIREALEKKYTVITIDGARIRMSDTSWGLIRASNTSPYLTIRVEADTEEEVIHIKNILADELEKFSAIGDRLNRTAVATRTGKLGWV